eukprot:2998974-Rhodomonas_salina.1
MSGAIPRTARCIPWTRVLVYDIPWTAAHGSHGSSLPGTNPILLSVSGTMMPALYARPMRCLDEGSVACVLLAHQVRYPPLPRVQYWPSVLPYAMTGTDVAYCPTPCPVLTDVACSPAICAADIRLVDRAKQTLLVIAASNGREAGTSRYLPTRCPVLS